MLFNTPIFFVFFVVFLGVYGLILGQKRPRLYFILVASLVFYGAWNYRFIPLLVGSSVIDYYLALAIGAATTQTRKKWLLTASVAMNLG
ncbi:MAG: MBOAT family O-acyltransferase, partial [Gammaproteobacteria bacterium]